MSSEPFPNASVSGSSRDEVPADGNAARKLRRRVTISIASGTVAVILLGGALLWRSYRNANRMPLGVSPRPVSVLEAKAVPYRPRRSYVGTLEPWVEANVGPQFVSAYVDTVLVRPGARVQKGEVLATLDCSNATAESRAIAMRARAVAERQRALANEAARTASLLDGGFVAINEVEQRTAESSAERARLLETKANLAAATLQVHDCILHAPFEGEIASRAADPGAFVSPGATIVSVVDRTTIRVTAEAPEKDFDVIPPSAPVELEVLATGQRISASVSRRAPKADPRTRTIHFEIDIADAERKLPVGTTGIVYVDVGQPVSATAVPVYAATVRGRKASLFVVDQGRAHEREVPVLGEAEGELYVDPRALPAGSHVVTEGRALLSDGDPVRASLDSTPAAPTGASSAERGGGFGRPL